MDSNRPIADLIAALAAPEAASSLVGRVFDYAVAQPIGRFVDRGSILEQVERALTEHTITTAVETVARGFVDRERERAKERGDRWGDWLPADAQEQLTELAGRPVVIDEPVLLAAIEQPAVRAGVRAMVKDTLDAFVKSVTKGGLLGSTGHKKGLFGGIGGQLQKQLGRGVSRFVDSSLNVILKRVIVRLGQPETQAQLGRLIQSNFVRELQAPTRRFWGVAKSFPVDDILDLVPAIVIHNIEREPVQRIIKDEVERALETIAESTVSELLDDDAALAGARAELIALITPLVTEFASDGQMEEWLEGLPD